MLCSAVHDSTSTSPVGDFGFNLWIERAQLTHCEPITHLNCSVGTMVAKLQLDKLQTSEGTTKI